MTSKQGKRIKKKVPKPEIEQLVELKMPWVECCHCNKSISTGDIQSFFGKRVCPFCGTELKPEIYNKLACDAASIKQEYITQQQDYINKLSKISVKCRKHKKWWQFPIYLFYLLKQLIFRKVLSPKISNLKQKIRLKKQEIRRLTRNSYYSTDWFFSTHMLLQNAETRSNQLRVSCNAEQNLELYPSKSSPFNCGITGEFKVYNLFLAQSKTSTSSLFNSRLLPNLYIPKSVNKYSKSFWAQIDLVILTTSCAFVFEVKNWRSCVYVDVQKRLIYSSKQPKTPVKTIEHGNITYYLTSTSLNQNSDHASWFYDNFKAYPFDRIYELTLFVNPKSFHSTCKTFEDNILAGEIGSGNLKCIHTIEEEIAKLSPLFPQSKVDKMAETLLTKYGDLNQRLAKMHSNRLS